MARALKLFLRAVVAAALLVGTAISQEATITILSVNDTHSHLDAVGPKDENLDGTIGGLVKASAVLGNLQASEPNPLLLHAGDLFSGDIYFNATLGTVELRLLAGLGLDAMTVGNHELWLGPDALAFAWQTAFPGGIGAFPLLGANVGLPVVVPNAMLRAGPIKVGVFGLTTPYDLVVAQYRVPISSDLVGVAKAQVAKLRADGAQVVVLLSHLGLPLDQVIAQNVPGIDVIVGGHDHASVATRVNGVPIVHAGAHYRQIGKVRIAVDAGGVSVASMELVEVNQKVKRPSPSESVVAATVAQLQRWIEWVVFPDFLRPTEFGDFFHGQIATAAGRIRNEIDPDRPKRDSGTGNLVTDALRSKTGTDVALTVSGQTPEGIAEGPIVGEDLFRVVGLGFDAASHFGWRVAKFNISGAQLWKAIETTIGLSLADDDYILQVSGMSYVYDSSRQAGERLLSVTIGNEPLDPARQYSATVNALLWAMLPTVIGGTFNGGLEDVYEFSALRDYVAKLGVVDISGENRARDLAARGR